MAEERTKHNESKQHSLDVSDRSDKRDGIDNSKLVLIGKRYLNVNIDHRSEYRFEEESRSNIDLYEKLIILSDIQQHISE
jgi:hypothetical protein